MNQNDKLRTVKKIVQAKFDSARSSMGDVKRNGDIIQRGKLIGCMEAYLDVICILDAEIYGEE